MATSPEEARAWLERVCRASHSVPPSELSHIKKFVCALRAFQADCYLEFVRTHDRRPILSSYSSDATPQSVAYRVRRSESSGSVTRAGRSTSDFLEVAVLIHPPVPMTLGKKRWHALRASERFAPTLKELKHSGFSILHFCFDRGFGHALDRRDTAISTP